MVTPWCTAQGFSMVFMIFLFEKRPSIDPHVSTRGDLPPQDLDEATGWPTPTAVYCGLQPITFEERKRNIKGSAAEDWTWLTWTYWYLNIHFLPYLWKSSQSILQISWNLLPHSHWHALDFRPRLGQNPIHGVVQGPGIPWRMPQKAAPRTLRNCWCLTNYRYSVYLNRLFKLLFINIISHICLSKKWSVLLFFIPTFFTWWSNHMAHIVINMDHQSIFITMNHH